MKHYIVHSHSPSFYIVFRLICWPEYHKIHFEPFSVTQPFSQSSSHSHSFLNRFPSSFQLIKALLNLYLIIPPPLSEHSCVHCSFTFHHLTHHTKVYTFLLWISGWGNSLNTCTAPQLVFLVVSFSALHLTDTDVHINSWEMRDRKSVV